MRVSFFPICSIIGKTKYISGFTDDKMVMIHSEMYLY